MKLHFVGIGGIGTSALAQLCAHQSDVVSGSNLGETAIWPELKRAGITLFDDHQADQLPDDADALIYSEAVPEDNPERAKARELNIPEYSYFEYLGKVSTDYRIIAVTGTHGKTTTTAMMAAGMLAADFPATMIVGSKLKEFNGSNFCPGTNGWLIVEACEYRNNFQYLKPEIVILTNLELDHVDYYESEDQYFETFADFVAPAAQVFYHQGDGLIESVLSDYTGEKVSVPANLELPNLSVPGEHNRANARLTLAAAENVDNLDLDNFKTGLSQYSGAWRRLECLGTKNDVTVYDDYGHHPTEIEATLQALRERHPGQTIALVFEPHQYSRTARFFTEFAASFTTADRVALYPIYGARDSELDRESVSRQHFIDQNPHLARVDDCASAEQFARDLKPGSVLIFMGAGNISQLAHQFVES